jgi:outer membrane protein OmpA-like peptidoglycan-associated protein
VTAVLTNLTTYNGLPADPKPPAPQPKATAKTAVGTSCGQAVRPGIDESAGEREILNNYITGWAKPIQFAQGDATLPADGADRMKWLGKNLTVHKSPVVALELHGHSSAEGSDDVNMRVSQQRVDAVETALLASGAIAPHTETKTAHGEEGATRDPSWRRVDFTVNVTSHKTNSLLDPARSRPIQDMTQLMIDLRNMGTDNSPGQRNVYMSHAYSVVAVNLVTTKGLQVPLSAVPAASRAALYPLVDADVSTVTLRNPHHGNEPDRRDNRTADRAGDGPPVGAGSDGQFTMTLREFFLNFSNIRGAVVPRTT